MIKDRTYLGSPVPKFTGGFKFILRYKGFDLEGYIYSSVGNKIFNQSKWFTDFYPSFQGAAISERVKGSWTGKILPTTFRFSKVLRTSVQIRNQIPSM